MRRVTTVAAYDRLRDLFVLHGTPAGLRPNANQTRRGPGRYHLKGAGRQRLAPAGRGGLHPTQQGPVPYLTYAESDRICRKVLSYGGAIRNRKDYRQTVEQILLERRATGAA